MLCACGRGKIRYTTLGLCRTCYERQRHLSRIESLIVVPCAGDCGRRVHNVKYVVLPGVVQGHGPNNEWCDACYRKYKPFAERNSKRGNCKCCNRPMMTGDVEEGFVQYWGKGLCKADYYRNGQPAKPKNGENNNSAKLTELQVIEIRKRCDKGDHHPTIAKDYGLHRKTISRIGRRTTWTYLPG